MFIKKLGQSGFLLRVNNVELLVDPYLSNSVQELDSSDLIRKYPIKYKPEDLKNIDWVLITHEHIDHCDPKTIPVLAKNNKRTKFIGSLPVRKLLLKWGIEKHRIIPAKNLPIILGKSVTVTPTAAAHPKLSIAKDNYPSALGWFFNVNGMTIYSAGDTSLCDEIITQLQKLPIINLGLLPVNEDNFFRRKRGIIGNMSIREAFGLADEIGIEKVLPMHWDLFDANGALKEEIEAIYKGYNWKFKLIMDFNQI